MNEALAFSLAAVASYLAGSIPFGFLLAKMRGIDIRTVGSGNVGATNVFRCVSKPLGIFVFFCDFIKGLLPTVLLPGYLPGIAAEHRTALAILCAILAVFGHNWPVFLRFRGGKGVATSTGALLGLAPLAVLVGLITWVIFFLPFRYVSLASIFASIALPAAGWVLYREEGLLLPAALTFMGLLSIWRHRSNIRRLMNGTESRISSKSREHSATIPPDKS